jgi:uncharacterized membrane protein
VLAELFGPLALLLGLAPRLAAGALIATTVLTTGVLHRFWEYAGTARVIEQTLFIANLGVLAGLLFFLVSGPGAYSAQSWWRGAGEKRKPAPKKKPSRPRAPKPRPTPVRDAEEELADAA